MTRQFFFSFFLVFLFCAPALLFGQAGTSAIQLVNPSFEGFPREGLIPSGWKDCGFPGESPPDTHPLGVFDVVKLPSHGNTYIGMVTRDNDTWERVTQQLSTSIKAETCYSFSLDLCRSELYVSRSRITNEIANYVKPITLIIWGGDAYCNKKERLAISSEIKNTTWQPYMFKFEPKQTHTHLTLEAFYKTPVLLPYNGNVLVDNASIIEPIPCDEEPVLAKVPTVNFLAPNDQPIVLDQQRVTVKAKVDNIDKNLNIIYKINGEPSKNFSFDPPSGIVSANITKLRKGNNRIVIQARNSAGSSEDNAIIIYEPRPALAVNEAPASRPADYNQPIATPPPVTQPAVSPPTTPKKKAKIEGFAREEITKGQIIKINSLSFKMNDSTLTQSKYSQLDNIYEFLREHKEVVIEIGGHTSGLCDDWFCNQLSTARAKTVAQYLQEKGIPQKQLSYKGYGKTKPIASNNTTGGRRKNQRVEIKILSTDG